MDCELELNKVNRLKLARAFRQHRRVDFSIDCAIEGQMGKAFVDNLDNPQAFRITVGPFWYLAGDAGSPGGYEMIQCFPPYNLMMPSPPEWLALAQQIFGQHLKPFTRYSFSSANLSANHLASCLEHTGFQERVIPLDEEIAAAVSAQPDTYLELSDFDSVNDFIQRGMGYTLLDGNTVMGVAYSSLVCSTGIEVSIFVEEAYRQKGVATALASRLLLECLAQGLRPNWDAANPESCKLATKLGYQPLETYQSYYHTMT